VFLVPGVVPAHYETEYGFAADEAPEVFREFRAMIEARRFRVNFIAEIRFVAADEAWLSPAFARESCQFGAYIGAHPDWEPFFRGFEGIARDRKARPHWGKTWMISRDELRAAYERLDDFGRIRRDLDPDGVFVNGFVARTFSVATG
jgi:L-gulonolactone oxidase